MTDSTRATRIGLLLGILAVVFWSFGASFVYLGAKAAGTWMFVAVGSVAAGVIQFILRRGYHGELRTAVHLPWRLWAGPMLCFVSYGLAWPLALSTSSANQVFGVSLINYLWPVLTVLFSVWLVPGVRLTARTVIALILAMTGLLLANFPHISALLGHGSGQSASTFRELLPYLLALVAAITWAVYSALLARWSHWAKDYVTSPLGFVFIGVIGGAVLILTSRRQVWPGGNAMLWTLLYALGPLALGYLLWEVALAKARVHALSVIAATTPVLSTFLLCAFLRQAPGIELVTASILVGAGVVLSVRESI